MWTVRELHGCIFRILEAVHTACLWEYLYSYTVKFYGQPEKLVDLPWELAFTEPVGSIASAIAQVYPHHTITSPHPDHFIQCFSTYRIQIMSSNIRMALLGWILIVLRTGYGITLRVVATRSKTQPVFIGHFRWFVILAIADNLALDGYNVVVLCFFLRSRRNRFRV